MSTDGVSPPDQNPTNPTDSTGETTGPSTQPWSDLKPSYPDVNVKSLDELRTRFPEIWKEWLKSLGMDLVNKIKKDEEHRKQHAKENQQQ